MAKLFPELVFLRGPQKGQRIPLTKTMNVIGRDKACDVEIQDEYASRQHARIIVEGTRARLVNTSPNGTKLNGKLTEQAILDDGDVIGFGLESEARFEAVESAAGGGKAVSATVTSPLPGAVTAPLPGARHAPGQPAAPAAAAPEGEEAGAKPRLKKPPAIIWVGVYLIGIAVLFVVLPKILRTEPTLVTSSKALLPQDIRGYIDSPLEAEPSEHLSQNYLDQAVKGYKEWKANTTKPNHLYVTFRFFKLALASKNPPARDFGTEMCRDNEGKLRFIQNAPPDGPPGVMDEVRDALVKEVVATYQGAYIEQRQGHWRQAQENYHAVLSIVDDSKDPIHRNVLAQLNVVNTQLQKEKQ
ncbi:MAG: FHA domain-containing protein, partial [Phycisphaerae bacterium]|nr:FHA domain-containing protein [Phycisphaerae bacterium]